MRRYKVRGCMVGACIVILVAHLFFLAVIVFSLLPCLFTSTVMGPSTGIDRGPFEISVFVTMAIIIGVGVWFYAIGRGHANNEGWPAEGTGAAQPEVAGVRRE